MKLNINFDQNLESIINSFEPLAEWFEKNQETMAYFDLTHAGCLYFDDNDSVHYDIKILSKMANDCLTYLEAPISENLTKATKAVNAALAIANIYDESKDYLSDYAKSLYFIDVDTVKVTEDYENYLKIEEQKEKYLEEKRYVRYEIDEYDVPKIKLDKQKVKTLVRNYK